ncbi:MAG TPA: Gfo/Idh/MocA family oxidoreductase [Bryobacteraceae bacterium]|nr:Gfo/Idh/MocA family oxidoreductase [Bryobacteraceae bacterium]
MNVAIIGCGLIGQKRLRALRSRKHEIVACVDIDRTRAESLALQAPGAEAFTDWRDALDLPRVDVVIVATTNRDLAAITLAAVETKRHALVEKPAARSVAELLPVVKAAEKSGAIVQVGFNHRFHPAMQKARAIIDSGELGPLMFLRGRYGHGGRIGYDREWRADPEIAGGGELLDQGVHLIDLSRWYLGDFPAVCGHAATYFWNMPVDDNGFVSLRTAQGQTAWLHVSCTEWKNLFSLEIYGRDGKLAIDGLGGSYGVERIAHYRMLPQMGPPETTIWEYPGEDNSWRLELDTFEQSIADGVPRGPGLRDALEALKIVEQIYRNA